MKISHIRYAVGSVAFVAICAGIVANLGSGSLSGFGIGDIAALCPLGSLEVILASKTLIPTALISLAIAAAVCVVVGKAFCSWVCPASFVREARDALRRRRASSAHGEAERVDVSGEAAPRQECGSADCAKGRARFDSRHAVLLAALASATVFGFPVFCLVCPIGLLFGTVVLLYQFFGGIGDVSASLVVFPLVLVVELLVMRGWCSKFCPLGALLSLLSSANRALRPKSTNRCLQLKGGVCSRCADVCPEGLDPHGSYGMRECSKCGKCKDACPAAAIVFSKITITESNLGGGPSSDCQRRK